MYLVLPAKVGSSILLLAQLQLHRIIHSVFNSSLSIIWTRFLYPEKGYIHLDMSAVLQSDHRSLTKETTPNIDGPAINSLMLPCIWTNILAILLQTVLRPAINRRLINLKLQMPEQSLSSGSCSTKWYAAIVQQQQEWQSVYESAFWFVHLPSSQCISWSCLVSSCQEPFAAKAVIFATHNTTITIRRWGAIF